MTHFGNHLKLKHIFPSVNETPPNLSIFLSPPTLSQQTGGNIYTISREEMYVHLKARNTVRRHEHHILHRLDAAHKGPGGRKRRKKQVTITPQKE